MSQTASNFLVQRLYDWGVPGEVGVCLAASTRVGVLPRSIRVHHMAACNVLVQSHCFQPHVSSLRPLSEGSLIMPLLLGVSPRVATLAPRSPPGASPAHNTDRHRPQRGI